MASYRYRAMIPAQQLSAGINQQEGDVFVFAKPIQGDQEIAKKMKAQGSKIIVDFCDDHFDTDLYHEMARLADRITCSSQIMRQRIKEYGYEANVIPDPYEYEGEPHADGDNLLWFGHQSNVNEIIPYLNHGLKVRCVTGGTPHLQNYIPWSIESLQAELTHANIVLIPDGKLTKSFNRAINATMAGCFVVAGEQHEELGDLVWANKSIIAGVQFSECFRSEINDMVKKAQEKFRPKYSEEAIGKSWAEVCQ